MSNDWSCRGRARSSGPQPALTTSCDFYEGCSPGLNQGSWLVRADQIPRRQPDEHSQECPYHAAESSHVDSSGACRRLAGGRGSDVVWRVRAHRLQVAGAPSRRRAGRAAGSLVGRAAPSACPGTRLGGLDSPAAARQAGGGRDRAADAVGAIHHQRGVGAHRPEPLALPHPTGAGAALRVGAPWGAGACRY